VLLASFGLTGYSFDPSDWIVSCESGNLSIIRANNAHSMLDDEEGALAFEAAAGGLKDVTVPPVDDSAQITREFFVRDTVVSAKIIDAPIDVGISFERWFRAHLSYSLAKTLRCGALQYAAQQRVAKRRTARRCVASRGVVLRCGAPFVVFPIKDVAVRCMA
jgi:hypothetical protein